MSATSRPTWWKARPGTSARHLVARALAVPDVGGDAGLPEDELLDALLRVLRPRGDEADIARHGEPRQPLLREVQQLLGRDRLALACADDGHHLLLGELGRDADHRRLRDSRMVVEHLLDLPGGDVLAAPADGVLRAVDEG